MRSVMAAVAAGVMLFSAAALGQVRDTGDLEAQHLHGLELRRQHRDAEARDLFRGLYERTHEPRALARQAAAEAAMGDWLTAEAHLVAALEARDDPWMAQNRAGLETDLALIRQHLGALEVISETPGAEVWIGGERRGRLPLAQPIRVRQGTVVYEVRAEGYIPEVHTVNVPAGAQVPTRETVNLTRSPTNPAPGARGVATGPDPRADVRQDAAPSSTTRVLRIGGLAAVVLGAAGLGVGTTGVILHNHAADEFNNDPACGTSELTTSNCRARFDEGESAKVIAVAGFVAGGVFLTGGVVMAVLGFRRGPSSRPDAPRAGLFFGPGPGQLGAAAGVRF